MILFLNTILNSLWADFSSWF
uniref:Similar to GLT1 (NADH-dependent glutamate synthase 1 gene) n=1 Tax=Arundo donax TaxID=35708 RepID=A0A0A9A9G3_ARUDO